MNGDTKKKRGDLVLNILRAHKDVNLPLDWWRVRINKELPEPLKIRNNNVLSKVFLKLKILGNKKNEFIIVKEQIRSPIEHGEGYVQTYYKYTEAKS